MTAVHSALIHCDAPAEDSELKPIPGHPGYFATSNGEIIGKRGRPMKPQTDRDGYLTVGVCIDPVDKRKQATRGVHRLVAMAFHGPPPTSQHEAAHLDNCPTNNRPSNLAWKTRQENEDDKLHFGTRPAGPDHSAWKMSRAERAEARAARLSGMSCAEIASRYGVSPSMIEKIGPDLGQVKTHPRIAKRCRAHPGEWFEARVYESRPPPP